MLGGTARGAPTGKGELGAGGGGAAGAAGGSESGSGNQLRLASGVARNVSMRGAGGSVGEGGCGGEGGGEGNFRSGAARDALG